MYRFQDAAVDADHDRILSRFDALCGEACWELPGPAQRLATAQLAEQLRQYCGEHFQREEGLLAGAGYPELEAHRQAHAAVHQAFEQVLQPMLGARASLQDDLRVIRDLFIGHIMTWDETAAEWLGQRHPPRQPRLAVAAPAAMAPGRIRVQTQAGVAVLQPQGRITLGDGHPELGSAVRTQLDRGVRKILVDFSQVTHLDSTGLGELVGCFTSARTRGGQFKVCAANDRVARLLQLTSLNAVFDMRATRAQGLSAF